MGLAPGAVRLLCAGMHSRTLLDKSRVGVDAGVLELDVRLELRIVAKKARNSILNTYEHVRHYEFHS